MSDGLSFDTVSELIHEHPGLILGYIDLMHSDTVEGIHNAWERIMDEVGPILHDRYKRAAEKKLTEAWSQERESRIRAQGGL